MERYLAPTKNKATNEPLVIDRMDWDQEFAEYSAPRCSISAATKEAFSSGRRSTNSVKVNLGKFIVQNSLRNN
jgi:hypothetical protein